MSRKDNNFESDESSSGSSNSDDSGASSEENTSQESNSEESSTSEESNSDESSESSESSTKKKEEKAYERPLEEKKELDEEKGRDKGRSGKHVPHFVMFAGIFLVGIIIGVMATPSLTGSVVADAPDENISGLITLAGTDIGAEAAAKKATDYIMERLSLSYPGIEVAYEGIGESEDIPNTYEVSIVMTFEGQPQTAPYHVTKDGKWMFGGLIDLDEELPEPTTPTEPESPGVPKSDKPVVDLFIMSYCPYGLQAQKAMLPVMELLGDNAEINIKWVSYVMHGKKEIDENNVQYCIQKEEPEKYVVFAHCFTQKDDSEACREEAGIDEAKLEACISALDEEFKISELFEDKSTWSGGSYPQYPVDAEENAKFGVRGSPTLVINGITTSAARVPEAYKQVICNAFNTPPIECEGELPTGQASAGFGGDFESGVGTAAAAQCA